MPKRIVVISPDGSESELDAVPGLAEMQRLVGGDIEHVRVLDRIEPRGARIYTSMFVNETGLIDGLPRNERATAVYQRNVRTAYPGVAHPFRKASEEWLRELRGAVVVDATPDVPGYADDPWISGTAILFEGWTCEEVDAAMT